MKAVLYLDDGIFAVQGEDRAKVASLFVQNSLVKAGLLANAKKSAWYPSTKAQWLGFEIDLQRGCICVSY